MSNAVWEVADLFAGEQWHSCESCAYKFMVTRIGIHADLVLGKNFKTEDGMISISEDVFGEHAECDPVCESCEIKLN